MPPRFVSTRVDVLRFPSFSEVFFREVVLSSRRPTFCPPRPCEGTSSIPLFGLRQPVVLSDYLRRSCETTSRLSRASDEFQGERLQSLRARSMTKCKDDVVLESRRDFAIRNRPTSRLA